MGGTALSIAQVVIGVLVAVVLFTTATCLKENEAFTKGQVVEEKRENVAQEVFTEAPVEIQTKNGRIQGVKEVIGDSRVYYSFMGIPFAEPPVGDLRLKDPVAVKPWSGIKGGQKPPQCPQANVTALLMGEAQLIGEEDCLYLNVFTPRAYTSDLPVMVYVHGGGYFSGSADFGGKPRLLMKDIVLVAIQYRLGTLGFLSTEDSILPGNYGMKDQTLALRWVQENIQDFGGDPNKVTLFGYSSGAASVHLHLLSPHSEGLFHQAILQSGTALAHYAVRDDHKKVAAQIGKILECPGNGGGLSDTSNFLHCLQNAPLSKVGLAHIALLEWYLYPLTMLPRVDGDYIPAHPAQLMKEGRFRKVNVMAGITSHEASSGVIGFLTNETMRKEIVTKFDDVVPLMLGIDTEESATHLAKKIFYHYMDKIEFSEEYAEELVELVSDSVVNIAHDESLLFYAKGASAYDINMYAYEFEYRGQRSLNDAYNVSYGRHWVSHVDDILYFVINTPDLEDPTDLFISNTMVQLWTNFAITGNPTPDLSLGFKWHPMTKDSYCHLALRSSPVMQHYKRTQRREFWKSLPLEMNKLLYPEDFEENCSTIHQ